MQAQQRQPEDFIALDQVMQVSPAVLLAAGTGATGIQRGVILPEAGVFEIPALAVHQRRSMAAQTRWQHAIKQIHPMGHGLRHLRQGAHPHQVAGLVLRQQRRAPAHHLMHGRCRLTHADAANGTTRQIKAGDHPG